MKELELIYAEFLTMGFVILKRAVESGNKAWIDAEIELLHNVPSLLGETNKKRHQYFWEQERTYYIEKVSRPGLEKARDQMNKFYEPLWKEIEPLIKQLPVERNVGRT